MRNLTVEGRTLGTQVMVVGLSLMVLALGILAVGAATWVFASVLRASCAG